MSKSRTIMSFDWAIKTVLRDKANFDVLEGFLSALLKERITVLELLESESNQLEPDQKYNRVDLMVKDEKNRQIIIELQYTSETAFLERLLYSTSKVIVENLKLGDCYQNIKKVISISIVYFSVGEGNDYVYHGTTEFKGIHTKDLLQVKEAAAPYLVGQPPSSALDKNVFPEYYLIPLRCFDDDVQDDLDEWIYAFKHTEVLDEFHSFNIDALKTKLTPFTMDKKSFKLYEAHMRAMASAEDMRTTAENAEKNARERGLAKGLEQGLEQGLAKGLAKGLEQGLEQGLLKGRQAGQLEEREKLRKNLIAAGLSHNEIEKILE